jgi:hypothetical protein
VALLTADETKLPSPAALRKGGLWVSLTGLVFLACAVLITLLAEQTEERFGLNWDLTQNRVYSISEATRSVLAALDRDVVIYTLYRTGEENITIGELLRRYEMASPRVEVRNIDPVRSPLFTQQFEEDGQRIENNSIIVSATGGEGDFRVIRAQNLYEWQLEGDRLYATGLVAEQRITSAIAALTGGPRQTAYFVEGHGEKQMSDIYYLGGLLENEDYLVRSYSLIYNDARLTENDTLFFVAPRRDLSDEETGVLEGFFGRGGKAVFYIDLFAPYMPNFAKVLDSFGLKLNSELVVEADSERFLNDAVILNPLIENHPATRMLRESGAPAVMPRCLGITITKRQGVESAALYTTSAKSFGKTDPLSTSLDREKTDSDGPFVLAAAAENLENKSRVALFGNTDFITRLEAVRFAGNLAAFMGGVIWLTGRETSVAIHPKSLVNPPLNVSSSSQSYLLMCLVVALFPCLVLAFGFAIWRRRMAN